MFNWLMLFNHLLWILGLTLLISSLSLAQWHALQQGRPLHHLILRPFFYLTLLIGLALFALGLTLIMESWWYKLGWLGLIAVLIYQGSVVWRKMMQ